MTDNFDKDCAAQEPACTAQPASMDRRNFLRKGGAAMPAVLTLQSGAALAATSAYIGTVSREGSNIAGHVFCLDTRNAEPLPNGTTYRFVDTYADVYVIPDGHYYPTKGRSGDYVLADEFCRSGGTKFLDDSSWPQIDLPQSMNGGLVSASALTSISAAMDVKKIPLP